MKTSTKALFAWFIFFVSKFLLDITGTTQGEDSWKWALNMVIVFWIIEAGYSIYKGIMDGSFSFSFKVYKEKPKEEGKDSPPVT